MNYLAHLYLSQDNSFSKAGNLMADFLKHVDLEVQPQAIRDGIKNHQATDKFADHHFTIDHLKEAFDPKYRRFVPIAVDVVYDHMLAKSWQQYHDEELRDFTARAYQQLAEARSYMPSVMAERIDAIAQYDVLASYVSMSSVEKTLKSISRRMRFKNTLDETFDELLKQYDLVEESFHVFFPELCAYIEAQSLETS
ncbi:DUF479 domain-containing protein [Leucothrix sargassi]|nr:DUF479 domain-containing protein [Leucothrix sargassi]